MFNHYYDKEHNLIYDLWRDVVSFRKQFSELKGTTERDLKRVRNDLAQTGRSLTSACFGFLTAEAQGQVYYKLLIYIYICSISYHTF